MITLQFDDFRCFGQGVPIEVRPITFLVGENSAGKTSFLAGARFLFEGMSKQSQNSFNRDPYFLGGFEQIAHYRGGRNGRAKKFSLTLTVPQDEPSEERTADQNAATHCYKFVKGFPQPELESYKFTYKNESFEVSLAQVHPKLTFHSGGEARPVNLREDRFPPSFLLRNNIGFVTHFIDMIRYENRNTRAEDKDQANSSDQLVTDGITRIYDSFRRSIEYLSQNVFASAPVRTQPLRTYTPSEIVSSSEGSHVPLELARIKLRTPEDWKSVKQNLVDFGNKSGLFSDIDIRQLGKSDIDPFQVLVKINGPAMNLVDVGYGISQILPIVYQMQNASRFDTFLLQQPEVHLHPRAQAELGTLLAKTISGVAKPTLIVETHSDFIIDRIGVEIAQGRISKEDVTIIFFEREQHASVARNVYFNENGELVNPPDNFRAFFLEEQAKIFGVA